MEPSGPEAPGPRPLGPRLRLLSPGSEAPSPEARAPRPRPLGPGPEAPSPEAPVPWPWPEALCVTGVVSGTRIFTLLVNPSSF